MKALFSCAIAALAVTGALASSAKAQIGSGWTQFSPNSEIQIEVHDKYIEYPANTTSISNGGVRYSKVNGVETYSLVNTQSNRVERRYFDEYSTRRQFQADVNISSPTDNESIHQVFGAVPDGPYQLMAAYSSNGGSIGMKGGAKNLITHIYGKWVRINSIHDKSKNITAFYINGSQKVKLSWGSASQYRTKYGVYGSLKTSSAKVQFKNVKMFK